MRLKYCYYRPQTEFGARSCFYSHSSFCSRGWGGGGWFCMMSLPVWLTVPSGSLCIWSHVPSGGGGISVQGVSVWGVGLCPGGLFLGRSLSSGVRGVEQWRAGGRHPTAMLSCSFSASTSCCPCLEFAACPCGMCIMMVFLYFRQLLFYLDDVSIVCPGQALYSPSLLTLCPCGTMISTNYEGGHVSEGLAWLNIMTLRNIDENI